MKLLNSMGLLAAILVACLSFTVSAHHSRSFFAEEVIEVEGVLTDLNWRNPHIVFTVETDEGDTWRMESGSIYMLARMGIDKEVLEPGIRVRVAGQPSTRSDDDMLASNVLLPDGQELLLFSGTQPRWSGELIGGRDRWQVNTADVEKIQSENRGIFRVWSIPDNRGREEHMPYTEAALAARAQWDPVDNFIMRCEQPGMPRPMLNPHPFEFIDNGDNMTLLSEEMDVVRTIHMADAMDPAVQPPSPQGYSVGRWEGNTLVVETSRIDWPWFDGEGTPQSEDVFVEERFTLSEDQSELDYLITITDPATFTEPASSRRLMMALGEVVEDYVCEVF